MAIERIFKGFLGLVLILGAIYLLFGLSAKWFLTPVITLIMGSIPFILALVGLVFIMLSFEK